MSSKRCLLLLLAVWSTGCRQIPVATGLSAEQSSPVQEFDPHRDYFPHKVRIVHARGVGVQYAGNYKIVTIRPGGDSALRYRYIVVQRGTPRPAGFADAGVIEAPVDSFTVEIFGGLQRIVEDLGLAEHLVGISSYRGIFPDMPGMAARRARGLIEIGGGAGIDLEAVFALRPQLIIADYSGIAGSFEPLERLRIRPFAFANRLERSPLACAEWIKVLALLFNKEQEGNALFSRIEDRYQELRAKAAGMGNRPQVLPFRVASDWWQDRDIDRQLIRDAGGDPVPPDRGNWQYFRDYPYELVLDSGKRAALWPFAGIQWKRPKDVTAADSRLGQFRAVREGRIYHPGKLLVPRIVNPFYIAGYVYPDQILADLVHLLHPGLIPEHKLRFFQPISSAPSEATQ